MFVVRARWSRLAYVEKYLMCCLVIWEFTVPGGIVVVGCDSVRFGEGME